MVASSTHSHLDIVLASLAAGKAVFCEKPFDLDLARLRRHAAELAKPTWRAWLSSVSCFEC
ncbi:MAG TPA: Gfo/Idh/MocA family oxidoreductase [Caulobacteraceae bacterium]|nr:Gfo/Idh/MocA family oxidoreductase [Caulobacteraceae bacterium]